MNANTMSSITVFDSLPLRCSVILKLLPPTSMKETAGEDNLLLITFSYMLRMKELSSHVSHYWCEDLKNLLESAKLVELFAVVVDVMSSFK